MGGTIKFKVTILFVSSLILMLLLGVFTESLNSSKNRKIIVDRYLQVAKELMPLIVDGREVELFNRVKKLNLKVVDRDLNSITKVVSKPLTFGAVEVVKESMNYYLRIIYLDDKYLISDKSLELFRDETLIIRVLFVMDIAILLFIFLYILKIIAPIKELSKKMQLLRDGKFIKMDNYKEREISLLAKSFNDMAKALKESIEDRETFLRYIGHEIKTPLAKTKFAIERGNLELVGQNVDEIDKFITQLLNFHLITRENLNIKSFKAQTLIVEALHKSILEDDESVKIELNDFVIEGDFEYLTIAIKNLIDNGLKYTERLPIEIVTREYLMEIISCGERLKRPLKFYLEPFNRESKSGYGLGLSLVDIILKKHGFSLLYRYRDGKNIFLVKFRP
jgi:two-component system OmpR family sensor kinase